jgi:hypothetical protein
MGSGMFSSAGAGVVAAVVSVTEAMLLRGGVPGG